MAFVSGRKWLECRTEGMCMYQCFGELTVYWGEGNNSNLWCKSILYYNTYAPMVSEQQHRMGITSPPEVPHIGFGFLSNKIAFLR